MLLDNGACIYEPGPDRVLDLASWAREEDAVRLWIHTAEQPPFCMLQRCLVTTSYSLWMLLSQPYC